MYGWNRSHGDAVIDLRCKSSVYMWMKQGYLRSFYLISYWCSFYSAKFGTNWILKILILKEDHIKAMSIY